MKVLVIGAEGSIGSRYCACLKYLGCEVVKSEIDKEVPYKYCDTRLAIVATPSSLHYQHCKSLLYYGYRVLCEKGNRDKKQIEELEGDIQYVNNWKYVLKEPLKNSNHLIVYRNFFPGKEDLKSNLFQPIVFADNLLYDVEYPFFEVWIDDNKISRDDFDESYMRLLTMWLEDKNPGWNKKQYLEALELVNTFSPM